MKQRTLYPERTKVKPFLKWAGGKRQLMAGISECFPEGFTKGDSFTYVEPFLGGGAVFFHIYNNYKNVKKIVLNDANTHLIKTYREVQGNVSGVIRNLDRYQGKYHSLSAEKCAKYENSSRGSKEIPRCAKCRRCFYDRYRDRFNSSGDNRPAVMASLFIFLNRTCFNGLYRVNPKGHFNVPMGKYKLPIICDKENLRAASKALKGVILENGDYSKMNKHAGKNTLFYIDPPYKPLKEDSFTQYTATTFDDESQKALLKFCNEMWGKGSNVLKSNSSHGFIRDLYEGSGWKVKEVSATRAINSKKEERGKITEFLICNFAQREGDKES
jgi:DNA adenine methylase